MRCASGDEHCPVDIQKQAENADVLAALFGISADLGFVSLNGIGSESVTRLPHKLSQCLACFCTADVKLLIAAGMVIAVPQGG